MNYPIVINTIINNSHDTSSQKQNIINKTNNDANTKSIVHTHNRYNNKHVYPISFSIPYEKIVTGIPNKTKLLATIVPGKPDTYIFGNSEKDYYADYQCSLFGITTKKAGWDCMRHYEIMANGCIPYFPDITNCPIETMTNIPKDLIIEGNQLYIKYKSLSFDTIQSLYKDEYTSFIDRILLYTRNHLTTEHTAKYILNKVIPSFTNSINVLFISGSIYPDYLRCLCLHGLKRILGSKCHDYMFVPHMYTDYITQHDNRELYGNGFTYSRLLAPEMHDFAKDKTVEKDIMQRKYDIVIYGSLHRGLPYIENVRQYYPPDRIVFLCGEDIHQNGNPHICPYKDIDSAGHFVFIRELGDILNINE